MVNPDWAIAASYGPAQAQPPRRREPWGGAPPSPDWGEVAVRRRRSRPSRHTRVGVGDGQLTLRVRPALARTRALAGESASVSAWWPDGRLTGDERRG